MIEAIEMARQPKAEAPRVGRPKERPDGEHSFNLRLELKQWRLLQGLAAIKGLSATEAISRSIDLWLDKDPELVAILKKSLAAEFPDETPETKPTPKKPSPKKKS